MTKFEVAYRKMLSLLLLLCFVSQNSGWTQVPQAASVMKAQSRSEFALPDRELSVLPASLGRMEEIWTPSAASSSIPRVVLIQDAHGQSEAQKNTQAILEFLHRRLNFSQIIIEGGVGKLDPSRLIYFQEEKFNQAAAGLLFQESEIGGPELFLLAEKNRKDSGHEKVQGWGAEDKTLYLDNLQAYQDLFSLRETASSELAKSLAELQTEASRSMNKELYSFFVLWMGFEAGSLPLEQDIQNVQAAAARHLGYQWTDARLQLDWPMLVRYQELKRREALLNADAADGQAKELLRWAENARVKDSVLSGLRNILENNNEADVSEDRRVFWENFYGAAGSQGFSFERYPDLFLREGFHILEGEVEGARLFEEVSKLRAMVLEKLQKSSREMELLEGFRDYLLLKKFFRMELTREEFASLEQRFGGRKKIPQAFRGVARKALRYYQLALARDQVMAQNVIRRIKESSSEDEAVILISGGFHRLGMSEVFRKEGVPYAVISPHFSEVEGMEKYEASMTGKTGLFDLSSFKVRAAQWMSDWQGSLPSKVSARRETLEAALIARGLELGATLRSELRAAKPWKDLSAVYDDIDKITGFKKTPGRKKQDPAIDAFLKFVRYETEFREVLVRESDPSTVRILFSTLTDWLDGNLTNLLSLLEEQGDRALLGQLLDFSRRNMESPYADSLVEAALRRAELAAAERRREARKKTVRKTKKPLRQQPKRFSARPKSDSVRAFTSADERTELLRALQAEDLSSADERARIKIRLNSDFFKGANPWLPMAQDAVKLSFPKSFEGKTVILEEDVLPGNENLRQIRLYENAVDEKNYLFSFIESETLGFSRSSDSFFVSADYTFSHPQFPEETFWVLTTQNFDVSNPQNKFRVITGATGNLLKVIDASATVHPVYEVYDEAGEKRIGFFVMRMDGLWTPSEDFRGIVRGFPLGRERSQRGTAHDTAYIRVPGKNVYVAPGTEGLKKAEVTVEGRTPVSVKVGGKTYDLILKRNQKGALVDVAREGFYDRIGNFTGTITRFKADSYGRASLGAPITGAQVADASKDGVWVSAALENGALIRTDEWKNLPPSQPYVFEMEKADAADSASEMPTRVISIRLAESKTRPKKTHDFLVLRDFQGKPLDSYKLRIPGDLFEKHAGQVTGFKIHARGDNAGRLQMKGKDYQLPGEYRDHPVTLLQFPDEKKRIFIVHSKTRTQIKDAYIYEMEGGEYAGSHSDAASLEKELKLKYKYPFDLSRVWREKIRSEETYEAARAAFEQGDLDAAEQILRGVSLKARRQYRLAQQLLNSWIPKRRALLASGPERNQRRLRRSFEKAAEQDQRQSEEESADEDPLDARSELRAKGAEEAVRLVQAENLREQNAHAFRALPTWLRVGDEALDIFSKRRAEIEAQPPHPELTGTLLEFLQTAYEERMVPFALERWIADAYEKKLRKIREKEFRIYLFDWIDLEDAGQVAAYYDEKANRLFLSRELLEVMRKRAEGGHSLRQGLLFEMLFPSRKVAVLGASGKVGREVYDLLRRVYPEVIGTSFSSEDEDLLKLDVTREEEVDAFLNRVKPDVVVYAAGVAGVEEAEKNKARAELLNVSVPERIAKIFPGQLVYFSSDYVFDGTEAPYKPKAETKPLNFYGETKARGETAVLNETGNTVIRLGLVYGTRVPQGGDPFHQVIEWIEGKGESKLVLDDKQVRHPVWAGDVAGVVLQTINTQKGGIVQLNGAEDLSRYRFAEEVSEIYRRLYPSWLESPGSNLTSTQMWQWRESEEVSAAAGAAARPQDAKMRNTVRPTRLEDVLRYLIPLYSVPDEGFFQELYAAFETGNFEVIQKISKTLENRSVRWAFVGRPEDLPGASENGVRIWNDSEREELYRYLIRDTKVQTSNAIRIRRVIDSMLMGIPEDKKGIVFLKPMTMGDEPNVELSLFPSFAGPKSMMYLLSYGYMEASSMGRILRFWVPTQRESDDEINETVKTELAGGSYSKIERLINPDGTTVIEKRAKISEDKGKLLAEARHMQSLQKSGDPAGRWFPEIFSIEEHDGWTVVRMQDLSWPSLSNMIQQAFPTGDDIFGQMVGRPFAANQSLMETIKMIYKTLTPAFYSQPQSATPEDFAEKYHFEKLEQRWREASEKSPWMRKLLEAPYLEFSGEREPLVLNLPTMLRIYRRINKLQPEIFKPPYLSKQHGDLHTGNILVDPFDFLKTGRIRDFKLIDPKYIPEGNDPLYDFAKLIHNYFGHYDLALNHSQTFHFDVTLPRSGKGPAVFENYFDDEASGTLMTLGRIDHFSRDFMRFIMDPGSDELFPFEPDPVAWRKRLLFTHASLMAGLLPFHVVGDNQEQKAGVIYARSAQLLGTFLEAIAVSDELGDSQDALQLRLRLGEVEIAKAGNNKKAFEEAVARLEQYLDTPEWSDGARSELRADLPPWTRETDQSVTIAKARQAEDFVAFVEADAVLDLLMQTLFQIRMLREEPEAGERKAKRVKKAPAGEIENPAALVVQRVYEFWRRGREFKTPDELTAFFEPLEVLARRADGVAPFLVRGLQAKLLMMAGFRENAEKEVIEGWPQYDRENYAFALARGDAQAVLAPYTAIGLQHLFAAMHKDLEMVKLEAAGLKADDFETFGTLVRGYHFWREARSRWDSAAAHYQEAGSAYALAVARARRAAVYAEERLRHLEAKYSAELGLTEIPEDLTAKQELEAAFNLYRLALAVISPSFDYHVFNRLMTPALKALAMDKKRGMQARSLLRVRKVAEGLAEVVEHSRTHTMGGVTIYEDVLEILATAQVHSARALKKLGTPANPPALSPFAARLDGLIELMDRDLLRGYLRNERSVEIYYPKLLDAVAVFEKILRTAKRNSLKGRDLVDLLRQAGILMEFFGKEPDSVYDNHETFLDSLKNKGYEAEALNEGLKSLERFLLNETRFNLPRSELRHSPFEPFLAEENIWVRENPVQPFPGVTLQNIARAQKMLRHFWAGIGEIQEEDSRNGRFQVPLVESAQLNVLMEKMTGLKNRYYLYYLPELPEGSFKPYLAADLLDRFFDHPENLAKLEMVVAESTGNQGKAVASLVQKLKQHPDYAPYAEKLKAVIFVPRTANPDKVRAMKDLGAAVVNRRFSAEELRRYVQADQAGRLAIEAASSTPYFEDYKDASAYVSAYAAQNPETSHYIRHGAPMGVAAYAVIMLEALDQWYRLQFARGGSESPRPVSSSDFDAFIKFVAERPEFSNIRFWVPGGSAGLGSGIAQIKQVRPDVEVFLTQVPGVDHVFKSLQAGHLIPKDQASFDPEALRYVDGIAATAEETTYEIVRSMADAVMRVPHEDNNKMARLILSLGIQYKNTENVWRYLESELSPFLPLTNAVYSQFFQSQLPSLGASGKHILIPVTGRTMDAALEAEIKDIPYHAAYERLQKAAGRASARSELRTLDEDDRQRLKKLEAQITDRKTEAAVLSLEEFRKEAEAREPSEVKDFILQNLRVYEARLAFDEGRFEEARRLLDLVAEAAPDFKDASSTRTVEAHRELLNLFEKYKARIESEGYEFVRKLGTGTFGDGYLFRKREDGSKAVLKVIGGTSLDMKDAIERMSASGQLAVEIDVNDKFFAAVGEDPEKAVIPRNILVYEEENELGLSMPEAIVMNFLEGRPASDFLLEATEDDRRIFFEQVEDRWLDLLRDLKAGGYLLLDYRPDNFFFKIRDGNLVIESVDRGIMSAYPDAQDESLRGRRELSAVGAVGVWKDITGQPAALDFRDRIRAVFDLEPETEAYMKKAVRQSDEARISEFGSLLRSLGFDFRGDDGKIGHSPDYKPLETAFNLVLIPHGVTDANKRNVFHGRADSKDENLINDEGRRQAAEGAPVLAEMIRSLGLNNEDLIFLRSPLRRTGQTAEISLMELQALIPGLPLEALVDPDVTELSFGEWDGKTLAEIEAEFGSEEKENAQQLRILNAVMRAPSGENFLMLLKRVRGVLESWNMKYPGKTVVVYGHGTFAAAVRVLMQSPEARVSDYVTWRDGAVPPRGMPTLFPARSELRDSAGSRSLEFAREVGVRVTGGVFSIAAAVQLVSESLPAASAFAAQERLSIPDAEREQSSRVFSQLLALGGKAILPAQVIEAVTPRARELFVELFVQGAEQVVSPEASVYIAGESAAKIKETFFTYGIFQKKPSAQKLFEIHPQQESIIANRLNRYAVAVSLADAPSGDSLDGRIPAFLIRPEEIRKLAEADQARLLVRMTQLQLLAAVELKDQLDEAGKSRLGARAVAQFLQKAGVGFTSGVGGYWMPSVQSLLSENVAARLAAYAATVKSA